MTVQELIDELQNVKDKTKPVKLTSHDTLSDEWFKYEMDVVLEEEEHVYLS